MQRTANEDFNDVCNFTDESTIQLEHHSCLCFQRHRMPRLLKQRAKHPVKVHIWGRISKGGATDIIIFTGIMNAECLGMIFEVGLLPFVRDHFPDGHRLQQDNDPKHVSGYSDDFFKENGINWWCTPPKSPDLNPIEIIWGSLKQHLRNVYKPKIFAQLKEGIQQF